MTEAKVTVIMPGGNERAVVVSGVYGLKLVPGVKGFGVVGVTHVQDGDGLDEVIVTAGIGARHEVRRRFGCPTKEMVDIGKGVAVQVEHLK